MSKYIVNAYNSVSAKLGAPKIPGWKMDEVRSSLEACCEIFLTHVSSINIFVWAVALLAHAACKSFGALFAVRFVLGMCEGSFTWPHC
jgi:hypothetical protein